MVPGTDFAPNSQEQEHSKIIDGLTERLAVVPPTHPPAAIFSQNKGNAWPVMPVIPLARPGHRSIIGAVKQKVAVLYGLCLALSIAVFSCATTEGGGSGDGLSLDEAIKRSAEKMAAELPPETLLAVIAISSEDRSLSNYIMDELTGALVDLHINIVDRRNLDKVRQELNFQRSEDVNDETAQAIGKFLGASSVVTGQFVKVDGGYRCQLAAVNVETAQLESTVRLSVRLDTRRTDVLSLDEAIERSAEKIAAELSAGELSAGTLLAIAAVSSRDQNLSNYIMDELTGALVDLHINIVDRRNLDKVRQELNFQMSEDVSGETAQAIGKFLGANRVITGQFIPFGDSYRCRFSAINVETARVVSTVRLNVRDDRMVRSLIKSAVPIVALSTFDRGVNYYDQEDYETAIKEFTEAIKQYGAFSAAYLYRGDAHVKKEDYNKAIADYSQAIKIDPNNSDGYLSRGNIYFSEKKDYDKAIADYSQVIRLNSNNTTSYFRRAYSYGEKGEHDKAIADYTKYIQLNPNNTVAYFNRGYSYGIKGDYDKAIADYEAALRIDPNYTSAKKNLEAARGR
jgi:tetratricopeptide (TPR) repeat protein